MKKIIFFGFILIMFLPASLFAADAPVTMAANITNAVPGSSAVPIPVTVNGFTSIGQFTLTLKFDTTRVRYVSGSPNPALPGMKITYTSPSGNTQGKLVFTWTGSSNVSLATGATLASLTFSYVSGTGILAWAYNYGSVCQYKRYIGGVLSTINDTPKYSFYFNGGISNRGAPAVFAPLLPIAAPGPAAIPVTTDSFAAIGAFTLYLEYDPAVLNYQNTFTKNAAFGSSFQVGSVSGTGGKMLIVIQWYGSPVTLPNGTAICTLDFTYSTVSSAFSALTWFDNGPSCEFSDASSVLIDLPAADYYHNGAVAPALVAEFTASNLSPPRNVPVAFTDQSSGAPSAWNWTFDRPGVVFVNGTSASSQNPQVIFTEGGPYTVTLTVNNSYFADAEIKTGYIRAGLPGIWTGATSTDWSDLSNWDNYLVPDSITDVVIPSSAPNWPVFTGDLTIGVHCMKLTLSGTTSQLTVTGNLITP